MVIIAEIEYHPRLLQMALETSQVERIYGMTYDIIDENIRVIQWASGGDFEAFEQMLSEISEIREYRVLTAQENRKLYSILYDISPEESVYYTAAQHDFQLLESELTAAGGYLRCRIPSRDSLQAVLDKFERVGYEFTLGRLYHPTAPSDDGSNLTDRQREVLELAFERGYVTYPHEVTIDQLAAELDISDTAVSKHLWQGLEKVVAAWSQ